MSQVLVRGGARSSDIAMAALVILLFASVPWWADKGLLFLASVVMINAIFALSFNLVFGLTGLVSFGHAAFFAVGAYTTGLLLKSFSDVPFLASWLAAGVTGGLVAAVVAVVALRRSSGIYFAILTLALAELVHILISKSDLLGREDGMTGIKRPVMDLGLFSVDLSAANNLYYATLLCSVVLGAILYVLWHNRIGRLLAAIRQDADRVRFLGGECPCPEVRRFRGQWRDGGSGRRLVCPGLTVAHAGNRPLGLLGAAHPVLPRRWRVLFLGAGCRCGGLHRSGAHDPKRGRSVGNPDRPGAAGGGAGVPGGIDRWIAAAAQCVETGPVGQPGIG
ncbi:branched-chain amino acid ABC transporter permease [Polaromonas sp. P1-6]|nr:branched-chain amino acid ABC transporter permease [Polaromonas sp. P1-6]